MEHPASSLLDERAAGPAGSDLVNLCCLSSEDGGRGRVLARPRVRRGRPTREGGTMAAGEQGGKQGTQRGRRRPVAPRARPPRPPWSGASRSAGEWEIESVGVSLSI